MVRSTQIVVQPLGDALPDVVKERLRQDILATFGVPVQLTTSVSLPKTAWDSMREQYLGTALLHRLSRLDRPDALRLLGVLDADAYARGLNFCFGQARIRGREAFIALARLRPQYYGQPADPKRFAERAVREAVHELGHTFGLQHCTRDCVMRFANSLVEVDARASSFCPACQTELESALAEK